MSSRTLHAAALITFGLIGVGCRSSTAPLDLWVQKADGTPYAGVDVRLARMEMSWMAHSVQGRTDPKGHVRLEAATFDGPLSLFVNDATEEGSWASFMDHPALKGPVDWMRLDRISRSEEPIRVRAEPVVETPRAR